jgi:predicted 3-demethylubiquinone-9 3-methyltransferase (glyoxalase superfamily)
LRRALDTPFLWFDHQAEEAMKKIDLATLQGAAG